VSTFGKGESETSLFVGIAQILHHVVRPFCLSHSVSGIPVLRLIAVVFCEVNNGVESNEFERVRPVVVVGGFAENALRSQLVTPVRQPFGSFPL
jgi:hypothetical protein